VTTTNEYIWIAHATFAEMTALASDSFPLETGGMLLGYRADNSDTVVTRIVGPGPKAKHSRYRFRPDTDYQQRLLEEHFYGTGGKETYLGDWHTHPEGSTSMSHIDKRTLRRIAQTPSSATSDPVMAILAGAENGWELGATRYIGSRRTLLFVSYELRKLVPKFYS
jgi:integrative and conjugative element protein (TIGR02256 family)